MQHLRWAPVPEFGLQKELILSETKQPSVLGSKFLNWLCMCSLAHLPGDAKGTYRCGRQLPDKHTALVSLTDPCAQAVVTYNICLGGLYQLPGFTCRQVAKEGNCQLQGCQEAPGLWALRHDLAFIWL